MQILKKIAAACCIFFLITSATIVGTLAYETLTAEQFAEQPGNTVDVELVQRQRVYQNGAFVLTDMGEGLELHQDNKELVPLVGSAQYNGSNFDKYGMPVAEGYVDHIVQVRNTGTADAYVRVVVAIPAALDDANEAGKNALHWNLGNRFMQDGSFTSSNSTNAAFDDIDWDFTVKGTVDGIECNIYTFTYKTKLAPAATTPAAAFVGFYLDSDVDIVDGHITLDGVDTGFTSDSVKIHVKAQAVQAYGFNSAADAFRAINAATNPWAGSSATE